MSEIILDIETDGLNPSRVFCVGVTCGDGDFMFREPEAFREFLAARSGHTVLGHNAIGFDYPVLERLWGVDWSPFTLRDTMVMSRLANPSREGGHSLDAWGERLGFPKGSHDDWTQFSLEMQEYCERDVEVTRKLRGTLEKELEGFDPRSVELEHQVATLIAQQRDNGWQFNEREGYVLHAQLKERKLELEAEVRKVFVPYPEASGSYKGTVTKGGQLTKVGLRGTPLATVCGPFTHIDYPDFNLGSRQQIGQYLIRFGWKPKEFTETGQPKVDETILGKVKGIPEATLIAEYLTVQKRMGLVESWLDAVEADGRVRGYVNSNGAVTGRMTHNSPNVAQVPANYSPYGKACRELWIAREGYKLVGCDADGLELRMLAHYMNDPDFTKAVVEGSKEDGTDAHSINMRAAGLTSRDLAKTFIYAFLYGAGDAKIGSIVGGTKRDGAALKARFLERTPALAQLKERVERAAGKGYLRGLDGRQIMVRSRHAALNTLLQGAGAVVMKQALVNLDRMARAQKLDFMFVGNIHDEIQSEVLEDHAERFGKCASFSIAKAGRDFNLRCPLAGGYDIGNSWAETH